MYTCGFDGVICNIDTRYCIEAPLKVELMSDTSSQDGLKHHLPNNPWSKNINNNQNDCQTKGPNDCWYNSKTIV